MRIGVISDTHGSLARFEFALSRLGPVEALVHLGDLVRDALDIQARTGLPVHMVRGNCDSAPGVPLETVIEPLPGIRLLISHGHQYGVKYSLNRLSFRAQELECQAALFGHTHMPQMERQGRVLLLNPGSLSLPRGGQAASLACLELDDQGINGWIIPL